MLKDEAARFLGVSVRTLERLAASGTLKKGKRKGKTRPSVTFDPDELVKVKAELGLLQTAEGFRTRQTLHAKEAIGFRLDPLYIQRLADEGKKHGMSAADYARHLVISGIEDTRVDQFRGEVRALREALADAFYSFLILKCGSTEREASAFVADTILKEARDA